MCTVCGCGEGDGHIEGQEHGHSHDHEHTQDHVHDHGDHIHFGQGPAHAHAPGLSQARMVRIEQDILGKNDRYADANRMHFIKHGQFALNLVSSPGSGKTTLLTATLDQLKGTLPMAVIEGDQQTSHDADRIRATGVRAIQINTGKGCHLDAHMVGHALDNLDLEENGLLFIENVGNLVCPAAFDLGEAMRVVILSVTEGDDKPLKYPDMFAGAHLMLLNKIDLLPYVDFDVERCIEYARRINPSIHILALSARTGDGMHPWLEWLRDQRNAMLNARIAQLEAQMAILKAQVGS
ncbi:MAG: hydrogenase nickel incorporation protein HypB [Gammaproteobacteria bacterium]|nr:hydrogenase nickel incorporation protein HypB [Gammaproteobacteria bacterium]MCP5135241.1 hydrogenase nickel incorporation protein HypB [Gammaproteobacteria bacterium]